MCLFEEGKQNGYQPVIEVKDVPSNLPTTGSNIQPAMPITRVELTRLTEKLIYKKCFFADNDMYVRQQLAEEYSSILLTVPIEGEYRVVFENISLDDSYDTKCLYDFIDDKCAVVHGRRYRIPGSGRGLIECLAATAAVRDALLEHSKKLCIYQITRE